MYFLQLKSKTRTGVKTGISSTGEHRCSLELTPSTLIPSLSCSPLPLRKFNPLPCHCYNNLQLLDTSLSMTVTQNRCHTHLGQAVFQWYIFIPCGCCAAFYSSFPFVVAWGWAAWGRGAGHGTPSCYSFSRPDFFFLSPPEQKSSLVLVTTALFCALTLVTCKTWDAFQVCPCSSSIPLWKLPVPPLFQTNQVFKNFLLSVSGSLQSCFFLFIALDSFKEASISRFHFFNKTALMHFSVPYHMCRISLLNYPQGLGFFLTLFSFYH